MNNFVAGMIAGSILFSLILSTLPGIYSEGKKVIAECEKSLPRDEHCKLIGVPE